MEREAANSIKTTQALGMAGEEPNRDIFEPDVTFSQEPAVYADYFHMYGSVGSVMHFCFGVVRKPGSVQETVHLVLPNEVAIDLMEKMQTVYVKKKP